MFKKFDVIVDSSFGQKAVDDTLNGFCRDLLKNANGESFRIQGEFSFLANVKDQAPAERRLPASACSGLLAFGFDLLNKSKFDGIIWIDDKITNGVSRRRLSDSASKQFEKSLEYQIEIGSCSREDAQAIQNYFDEGFLHSGLFLTSNNYPDLSQDYLKGGYLWSEGISKPIQPACSGVDFESGATKRSCPKSPIRVKSFSELSNPYL